LIRRTALGAATAILRSGGRKTTGEQVLELAEKLEGWILNREARSR
jgi:hypothetical protein